MYFVTSTMRYWGKQNSKVFMFRHFLVVDRDMLSGLKKTTNRALELVTCCTVSLLDVVKAVITAGKVVNY